MAKKDRKKTIAIIVLSLCLALFLAIAIFVGIPMIRFIGDPERFRSWVSERGLWGKVAFVFMKALKVVICVIPGEPLELAAGYAFGTWEGALLCTIGTTIGSLVTFTLVRRYGMAAVRIFFSEDKIERIAFLKASQKRDLVLFALNVIPGTPKDLLNYFVGLTDMKFSLWVFMCSVGRIPSVITSTICGDAFGQKKYTLAIIVLVATLALGAIGVLLYNKYIDKQNTKTE